MTKEQKEEFLQYLKNLRLIQADDFYREGFDIAISALSEELSEDGTLTVHVSDGSKVKRVFVMGDNIFGGLYYPDSAENMGEWIPISKCGYPKPEDEYKNFLTIDNKGEITIQEFLLSLDEEGRQPYFSGMRNIIAWQPLPEPYKKGE